MQVEIVNFPLTRVAAIDHFGSPATEHDTVRRLVAWKLRENLTDPVRYRHYGVHFTDPGTTAPEDHHVQFCISVEEAVRPNDFGVVDATIPPHRCALARDLGSRHDNKAAAFLYEQWLPKSGETQASYPIFFHYVNVGPNLAPAQMITDVYLPLA
ncbi:MAG: GyrI-like domain-containing protein [Hyphomonadaceae bacterium]